MMTNDYRPKIYERYASLFQDAPEAFDAASARRWGKAYDYYFRGWLPPRKEVAIAELACGRGNMLLYLLERGYTNLEAVDISPEQVSLARQVLPCVEQGDVIAFLQTRKNRYNLIIALDFIEHLQKDEALRFLDLVYQALDAAGSLILQTPNAGSPWCSTERYKDLTHEICFSGNSLSRNLRLAGFRDVQLREPGPVLWGYSFASTIRACAWQCIRALRKATTMIETGSAGDRIYTRTLLARAIK